MREDEALRIELVPAGDTDIDVLVLLVGAYHAFEALDSTADTRREAVRRLLADPALGRIWLIRVDGRTVGYIALCFGYSIEFAGHDAFIDEFFIDENVRGRGVGRAVLEQIGTRARDHGIRALHLEVAKNNTRAQRLYAAAGFEARDKYYLMSRYLD